MGWDMLRVLVLFFIDPFVDNGKILAKKVKVGFKTSYDAVSDVAESGRQWRSNFQIGSRVLNFIHHKQEVSRNPETITRPTHSRCQQFDQGDS